MGNHGVGSNRGRIGDEKSSPPCPNSPNCVCTLGNSQSHVMPPYRYRNTLEKAKAGLKQVFSEMSRAELIQKEVSTFITKSPVFWLVLWMMLRSCSMMPPRAFISGRSHGRATMILA